jgi:hypothetical protein
VLLAPLPSDAVPRRQSVASPEVLARPEGASIAGWEQVTVELSAGAAGLRIVMVVLDATGQPIAASDGVLYRVEIAKGVVEYYHENVGGRLESDGTFRGARWRAVVVETGDREERRLETPPSAPSPADVSALKALVTEVLRRSSPDA